MHTYTQQIPVVDDQKPQRGDITLPSKGVEVDSIPGFGHDYARHLPLLGWDGDNVPATDGHKGVSAGRE
jgi:hypothetical protein